MERKPNTQYVLSLSYGKDSLACLEAIYLLGYPLDRIIHAEVWATDDIPADLPPMVEFKRKADAIIKFRYGIEVEHICALDEDGSKLTYEKYFYRVRERGNHIGKMYGFPMVKGSWCKKLKTEQAIWKALRGGDCEIVKYLGIAADEPERIERHKDANILPLVDIKWDESYCRRWCEENSLLSPTYSDSLRGGCWFCHNQSVGQLRLLRQKYPDYWHILLRWDLDSPVVFKPDGHNLHDYEIRFSAEDKGIIEPNDRKFRWNQILTSES